MKNVRVVYMGTPEFATKPLDLLIEKMNVVLVVTKEDAYVGRKKILTPSPVAKKASEYNMPVFKPASIKKEYKEILKYKPDLIITCAYGKIIPKELIDYPKYGAINIHASLLPKYRGAAPIQWALINGEKTTGITLMYMDEKMDNGDIIAQKKYKIKPEDDIGMLHDKLSCLGTILLLENLNDIINNNIKRIKQDETEATYAPMITREMEEIDFKNKVVNVYNKIRAFSPWPLSKTTIFNEEVKIIKAHYELEKSVINKIYVSKDSLGIGCLDGIIYLDVIKPIGKKSMNIKDYLNGKKELFNEKRSK